MAIYQQHDFVPTEVLDHWSSNGNTVGDIMSWLQVPNELGNAVLGNLEAHASAHCSVLSYVTPEEWEQLLAAPDIGGVPLSIGMRSRLRQLLLAARIVTAVVRAPEAPPEPAQPVTTIVQAPAAQAADPLTTVNIMDVYLQGPEPCRVPLMPNSDYQGGLDRYKEVEGREPPLDRRPTIEQATAFLAVLAKRNSIYADYAILVPHGDRALMRRHFTSRVLNSNGDYQIVEVYGPPSFREWLECHRVWETLCIMFNTMPGGPVRGYSEMVGEFDSRYPDAWGADIPNRRPYAE